MWVVTGSSQADQPDVPELFAATEPPDNNNDKTVNVLDILNYKPILVGPYDPRYDLNTDGLVNILDVLKMKPYVGTTCT